MFGASKVSAGSVDGQTLEGVEFRVNRRRRSRRNYRRRERGDAAEGGGAAAETGKRRARTGVRCPPFEQEERSQARTYRVPRRVPVRFSFFSLTQPVRRCESVPAATLGAIARTSLALKEVFGSFANTSFQSTRLRPPAARRPARRVLEPLPEIAVPSSESSS